MKKEYKTPIIEIEEIALEDIMSGSTEKSVDGYDVDEHRIWPL